MCVCVGTAIKEYLPWLLILKNLRYVWTKIISWAYKTMFFQVQYKYDILYAEIEIKQPFITYGRVDESII